jgi:glycosyltransferase involved in cell wall biosynthesis
LGVYASELARALRRSGEADVVEIKNPALDLWRFDRRVYWDQVIAPALVRNSGAHVAHFTGGTLPLRTPHPVVLSMHDLMWLSPAARGRAYARWYFGRLQPRLARRADMIVADTHAAREEIVDALRLDPARVVVCGAGVGERFFALERRPQPAPLALCIGTVEARKDLVTAVRAVALVPGLCLLSVGPHTAYARDVAQAAAENGAAARVRLRGWVAEQELLELYSRASLLVFSSRYEGFGLPPLQALAAGVPVVAADIPVMREILADCAWFAEPGDAGAFAAALRQVLAGGTAVDEKVRRGRARARTFTWDAVAARALSVYRVLR